MSCCFGCKSKINQVKDNLREGKWVTVDSLGFKYTIKGKYHKGNEIGTWRYFENNKLIRKEKYKKNKCFTKFFYSNGKLMQKGFTELVNNDKETHWYYAGDWYYYNEKGQRISIKTFEKGEIVNIKQLIDSLE